MQADDEAHGEQRGREIQARVEHGAPDQVFIGAMQALQHAPLLRRQVGDDPVQEERGFVEEPFGRFHPLDDDAARHGMELRILLPGQLPAGEYHDRHVRERSIAAHLVEHVEA